MALFSNSICIRLIPAVSLILYSVCSKPVANDGDSAVHSIVINEFMVNNAIMIGLLDGQGHAEDWVELYNTGDEAVNLKNLYISDKPSNPDKYLLPDTLLPPGAFYLFWAGDSNAGFGFSTDASSGEEVILADADGDIVDRFAYLGNIAACIEGRSYGRNPDGGDTWKQQEDPSPNTTNGY